MLNYRSIILDAVATIFELFWALLAIKFYAKWKKNNIKMNFKK